MNRAEFVIPPIFIEKRKESINKVLNSVGSGLFGSGVDVGCSSGSSCGILEQRGLDVTYVEKDPRCISGIIGRGYKAVNIDIIHYLPSIQHLDFITFFGAPRQFNIVDLMNVATPKLSTGGFVIVTGYPNIEPAIDISLASGGQKFTLAGVHGWDSVGFVYVK